MKLILAEYLQTLRERDEFDRLLPDLLFSMGYIPLSKPQTGARQYGVDVAVVGKSTDDGIKELILVVIKQGDIGRRDWSNGEPTAIRPTLDEILDVYLTTHIAPEYAHLRKTIVLATTGGIKQDTELNWNGYKISNTQRANFVFWGGDYIAGLIEKYMLNEHVFAEQDRSDLRKALALAGDRDYDFKDIQKLFLRQLGMKSNGTIITSKLTIGRLIKAIRRMHLAAQICVHWALSEGSCKQAIWISERLFLWTWHRLKFFEEKDRTKALPSLISLLKSYLSSGTNYYNGIYKHLSIREGLSLYSGDSIESSVIIFETLGHVSTLGLSWLLLPSINEETKNIHLSQANNIATGLVSLINNNPATASPRLDEQVIDILLAFLLLKSTDRIDTLKEWLSDMVWRLDYCFKTKRHFPIDSDSIEDLIALETGNLDQEQCTNLMRTSWCMATFAVWCALLGLEAQYEIIVSGHRDHYPQICAQLWHPTADWQDHWYFGHSRDFGESEAPFDLPPTSNELRQRLKKFIEIPQYKWNHHSKAGEVGLSVLDFIACRHFRMPVPLSIWYHICESFLCELNDDTISDHNSEA